MLITDGAQSSCNVGGGDAGSEAAVQDLEARGIKTFVVGFGSEVDAAELDKLATLGGAALPATPKYDKAETASELDTAVQTSERNCHREPGARQKQCRRAGGALLRAVARARRGSGRCSGQCSF